MSIFKCPLKTDFIFQLVLSVTDIVTVALAVCPAPSVPVTVKE